MKKQFTNSFFILAAFAFLLVAAGCKPDPEPTPEGEYESGVWIINQGTFQAGNSSVGFYDREGNTQTGVYQTVNSVPLGDVAQSATKIGDKVFIVVNNSQTVEVVNAADMTWEASIEGFASPRYLLNLGSGKAYVSELFGDSLAIVDLSSNQITGKIPTGGWTEQMALVNGKAFVTLKGGKDLLVINPSSDQITNRITLNKEPGAIAVDSHDDLWVLCSGGYQDTLPSLHKVNSETEAVEASFWFTDVNESPDQLVIDAAGEKLFWLNNGIWKMDVHDQALPVSALVDAGTHSWYSLGVDPETGILWVGDAKDYVSSGDIYGYSTVTGNVLEGPFSGIGIAPGAFHFQ